MCPRVSYSLVSELIPRLCFYSPIKDSCPINGPVKLKQWLPSFMPVLKDKDSGETLSSSFSGNLLSPTHAALTLSSRLSSLSGTDAQTQRPVSPDELIPDKRVKPGVVDGGVSRADTVKMRLWRNQKTTSSVSCSCLQSYPNCESSHPPSPPRLAVSSAFTYCIEHLTGIRADKRPGQRLLFFLL